MTGSSKNNGENYPRKCFWTQEKEIRVKFNPGLSANRPSNNWAQRFKGLENVSLVSICFPCSIWGSPIGFSGCGISLIWRSGFGIIKPNRARFGIESTREDQFTGLSFITLYSRFYWSRSTKDPADPHWFVVVVLLSTSVSGKNVPRNYGTARNFGSGLQHWRTLLRTFLASVAGAWKYIVGAKKNGRTTVRHARGKGAPTRKAHDFNLFTVTFRINLTSFGPCQTDENWEECKPLSWFHGSRSSRYYCIYTDSSIYRLMKTIIQQ